MVTHVAYCEERYRTAAECLAGIRKRLENGWWLSELRGPMAGAYIVIFGVSDELKEGSEPPL
jgi:hypothetical protein